MADFNEYKGVWVFCEQRQGALMSTDFELVSEARKLADELGCEVTGLLLGDNVEGIAKELGGYGADKVMVCDSPLLKDYTTDGYAKALCDLIMDKKPEIMLIGATNLGRDLGPRCAARLHTGLTADATHLDIDTAKYVEFLKESSTIDLSKQKFDYEDRNLKMTRPAFGGHLMATIICPRFRPQMSTVRPGVMKKAPFDQAKADACQIVKPAFSLTADDIKTEVLSVEKAAEKLVDLIGADVIVSVGRGISKDVNKGIELADAAEKTWGNALYACFDQKVEEKLIQPTFITMYPVEVSPLAKRSPEQPALTERYEMFICGCEMGNAFSELNDPIDQKGRFERQVAERKAIEPDCKAQVDYDYVLSLIHI